jgi:hypothetical protein
MSSKNTYKYPHELIFTDTSNILTQYYKTYQNVNMNGQYRIKLTLSNYGKYKILGCANLMLIIDLDSDEEIDFKLVKLLINKILFLINGFDVELIDTSNLIWIMINYYNLAIKQIGSKIYFPIPLSLFAKGFVPYYFDHFALLLHFNTLSQIYNKIKKISVCVKIFYGKLNFNEKYLLDYKSNNLEKIIDSLNKYKGDKSNNLYENVKKIINFNNFIFYGYDYYELIEITSSNTKKYIWTCIPRISNKISELFFSFINKTTREIVTTKLFNQISLKLNSSPIYIVEYEELIYDLESSGISLPKHTFRIPFENICSNGLDLDQDELTLCIDSDNIDFDDYKFEIYGLYKYKINLLSGEDMLNSNTISNIYVNKNVNTNTIKFTSCDSSNGNVYWICKNF